VALTPEQRAFVDWQLAQKDPLTGRLMGDIVAEKGLDPYRAEVAQFAQNQIDRGAMQMQAGGAVDTVAPWTQSNWRERQTAAEQTELARRQQLDREWRAIQAAGGNVPVLGPSNDPNLGNVAPRQPSGGSPPLPGADPLVPSRPPGLVSTGGNNQGLINPGAGNSGAVYGPDGQMYSSAAAAIAAGVTNFSYAKPMFGPTGTGLQNNANAFLGGSGSNNPFNLGLISGANQQLFKMPTNVQLPPGM
jgi:hypothetical protein